MKPVRSLMRVFALLQLAFTATAEDRATLTVGLLAGESLAVNMSLTPLAYVLGLVANQERLNYMDLEELHRLKVIL